jgi:hypothetical protein
MTIRTPNDGNADAYGTPGSDLRGAAYDHNAVAFASSKDPSYYPTQGVGDNTSCAFLDFGSATGSRMWIQGDVYVPTGSLDLSGKNNGSSFITDSLVARQVTLRRWVQTSSYPGDPNQATLGLPPQSQGAPRVVEIQAQYDDGSGTPVTIAVAHVKIDDTAGGTVTILCWQRRGGSC